MKIVVCIKQVPDTKVQIDIAPDGKNIVEDGLVYTVNPDDMCAVEAAVCLKEQMGGEIRVVTLGVTEAEEALRSCLAMGANEAIMILDQTFEGVDSYTKAKVLAQVIKGMEYDLIITGSSSLDGAHGQVPGAVAEILEHPFISGVTSLERTTNREIKLQRKLERGEREVVEITLPAVIAVTEGINTPRYASLPGFISAMRQNIKIIAASDLASVAGQLGAKESLTKTYNFTTPRPRPKKTFEPNSNLSPAERMKQLVSGGAAKKKSSDFLEGDPEEVANQIIEFLQNELAVRVLPVTPHESRSGVFGQ